MTTYEVLSEGNHIVPITAKVTFSVDITASYTHTIHVLTSLQGTALDEFLQAYCLQTENAYKTFSEFTTQDASRNVTYSLVTIGESTEDPAKTVYEITMTFTIENAEAERTFSTQTDLTGTEKDAFLLAAAEQEVANFKYSHGWVDL